MFRSIGIGLGLSALLLGCGEEERSHKAPLTGPREAQNAPDVDSRTKAPRAIPTH
ncbi:hypothetical protein ACYOEI_36185 [Singulisphaera rosea]